MWVNFAEQVNLHENEAKLREWVWAPRAHKLCPLSSNPFIELSGAPPLSNLHRAVARVKLVISILITAADRHLSFTPCVCMRWCLRRAPNQNSYPHRSTVGIWSAEWNFRLSSTCIIFWLCWKRRERGTFQRIYHEIWRRAQRRMLMRLSINPIREYTLQSDMICKIFPCLGGCADAESSVEKVALELIGVMLLWCFQTRWGCIKEETPKECTATSK